MSTADETEEQLIARHKKEQKNLIATVTGLKKQATKSKRKEVNKKCLEMELDLKERHEKELKVSMVEQRTGVSYTDSIHPVTIGTKN